MGSRRAGENYFLSVAYSMCLSAGLGDVIKFGMLIILSYLDVYDDYICGFDYFHLHCKDTPCTSRTY